MPVRRYQLPAGTYRIRAIFDTYTRDRIPQLEHLVGRAVTLSEPTTVHCYRTPGEPHLYSDFIGELHTPGFRIRVSFNRWVSLRRVRERVVCWCEVYTFPHNKGRGACTEKRDGKNLTPATLEARNTLKGLD